MNTVLFVLAVLWVLRILANLLSYVHLWFVKEYRFDRMRIHLRTQQGKRIVFLPFRRPPVSPKTVVLTVASVLILLLLFQIMTWHVLLRLFILDILTFPTTAVLVLLVQIPTRIYHELLIRQAVRKLRQHSNLLVIGITGSFGKTSTKEFLATILKTKFAVLATEGSKNSPIAIAEVVLGCLTDQHKVFLVEMGAYQRGEIARMAAMVRPQVGIVTAINVQHQDLFESLENTARAKYELIAGLTGKKIAIVNADNTYTRTMGEWARREGYHVWWYTKEKSKVKSQKSKIGERMFFASGITATLEGLQFTCVYRKEKATVQTVLLGEHQVSNILAAVAASVAVGMKFTDAARGVSTIRPFPKTMEPVPGIHGATFINDTFNNNPDAAHAAIAFLAKTKGRKILVFQPMIELGAYAAESHRAVGREAARVCDDVLLTNENFYEHFLSGAREGSGEKKIRVISLRQAASYIRETVKRGDTVLFKGKEAEQVLLLCVNR